MINKIDYTQLNEETHTNEEWLSLLSAMDKGLVKVPAWVREHFLGAVPPIYCNKGFLCSEPMFHDKDGYAVYRYFFNHKGINYGTISTKEYQPFALKLALEQIEVKE